MLVTSGGSVPMHRGDASIAGLLYAAHSVRQAIVTILCKRPLQRLPAI